MQSRCANKCKPFSHIRRTLVFRNCVKGSLPVHWGGGYRITQNLKDSHVVDTAPKTEGALDLRMTIRSAQNLAKIGPLQCSEFP